MASGLLSFMDCGLFVMAGTLTETCTIQHCHVRCRGESSCNACMQAKVRYQNWVKLLSARHAGLASLQLRIKFSWRTHQLRVPWPPLKSVSVQVATGLCLWKAWMR